MAIQALEFFIDGVGRDTDLGVPLRTTLQTGSADGFIASFNARRPAAYVVRNDEIDRFAALADVVVSIGAQKDSKDLAALLFGHDRIPILRGKYEMPGRLSSGIGKFLRRAVKRGEGNVYVIGTADHIFDHFWNGAATRKKAPAAWQSGHVPDAAQILERLPDCDEPAELRNERYIGSAACVQLVRRLILLAGESDEPVLILGPTGTGKDNVARAIHFCGRRRLEPFFPLNTAAISSSLFESELFGHVRGAFTGATTNKKGLWEAAGEGTLFLDEIGDLDLDLQKKILSVLDHGEILRVGDTRAIKVGARVVTATNRDLSAKVESGHFREDLYYRLRALTIATPALYEHPEDIAELANHLWRNVTDKQGTRLPAAILKRLEAYRWPGNVREMRMVLATLFSMFRRPTPRLEDLEMVFALQGQRPSIRSGTGELRDVTLHRAECLSHLQRTAEVIRACEVTLQPIAAGKRRKRDQLDAIHRALHYRLTELDLLCQRPLLFYSEATFETVNAFREKLEHLHHQIERHPAEASRYYSGEVKGDFKLVLRAIFKEVAVVVDGRPKE